MTFKASDSNIYDPSESDSSIKRPDKGTQTSGVNVNLMSSDQTTSIPCPKNPNSTGKDDDIKVFEFCQLIKDPEDDTVSIVKETFTEEVIKSPQGSIFATPTHNRYKYCREVIQPYCKAHSSACPKYPNYKEIPFRKSLKNSSDSSKNPSCDSCIIMCSDEKKTFENPSNASIKNDGKKRPCPPPLPQNEKKKCQKEAADCESFSKCAQYNDEQKLKDYLSSCISTTVTMAKKASATCIEKCEKTIGIRPPQCGAEKPTYYVMKKPKSEENVKDNKYENIFDSDIVRNITSGVKSIVDIVVSKTKATASMLTSSSSKESQDKDRKTRNCESKSRINAVNILPNIFKSQENIADENKTKSTLDNTFKSQEDTEVSSKTSLTNITSIFTNRFKNPDSKSENGSVTELKTALSETFKTDSNTDNNMKDSASLGKIIEPAVAAIERVASVVSSTASSTISSVKKISMTDIVDSRLDRSSPEDDPNIRRRCSPSNLSNDRVQNSNPSVFTMIKSKFYSMFSENKNESDDENENKEQETDKIFEKCYQCNQ